MYEITKEDQYKRAVEGYFKNWFPGGDVTYTPCGLAWRIKWGVNRSVLVRWSLKIFDVEKNHYREVNCKFDGFLHGNVILRSEFQN